LNVNKSEQNKDKFQIDVKGANVKHS
jgi:hypothetical protein